MKRRPAITVLLLAGVVAIALLAGCGMKQSGKTTDVGVFFVSDTRGRLVPCGCFSGQYGGLTRLKTALDTVDFGNSIRLDVGNAIRGTEDYNVIEYRYMQKAYAQMHFDALNLGEREAGLTVEQLRALKQDSPVTLISANLLDEATGAPVCEPWKIVERGGLKIGLLGVVDSKIPVENLGKRLTVEKIDITLGKVLPQLKQKADVIVLVAFTDEATLAHLAEEFYELDVILGGKVSQPAQNLERDNRSWVFYTGNEGRALGMLRTQIGGRGKVTVLDHEIRLLEDKVPEDDGVRALAEQYRDEVRQVKLMVDDPRHLEADRVPGVKSAATYVGSQNCVGCHPGAASVWLKSGHARAMETLISRKADADPNCLPCHTIGFASPSGYRREYGASKLVNVGCESCHGPGSLHVEQRQNHQPVTFTFRPLGAGDCQGCHFGEFSRPFDWGQFWPQIQHGKETVNTALNTERN